MVGEIVSMFNEGKSPYEIHMKLNVGIKQVYHVLKQREEKYNAKRKEYVSNKEQV